MKASPCLSTSSYTQTTLQIAIMTVKWSSEIQSIEQLSTINFQMTILFFKNQYHINLINIYIYRAGQDR